MFYPYMSTNDMLNEALLAITAWFEAFKLEVESSLGWQLGQTIAHDIFADPGERHLAGQVNTVITVVTIGLVAIIGILIFDEVDSSVGDPSNSDLSTSQSNVTDGFGDAMDLVPVVLLVMVASLVIAVVQQF